jgi:hypothetical protein
MVIDAETKFYIRQIVVELFKEILEPNASANKEVIQLEDNINDIIRNKLDNYKVEVYGVSLREY